jgi:hypothetical protein
MRRVGTLVGAAMALGALAAPGLGCNSLLANTDGVLYETDDASPEGGADATVPAEAGASDVGGPDQEASAPPGDASRDASGDADKDASAPLGDASGDASGDADQEASAPPGDASGDASGDADAAPGCDAGVVSGDASSPTLCPGGVVYVSPNGNDAHSGCAPCAAKLSIRSAIDATTAALAALDAGVGATPEIHVCAGTYSEVGLQLTAPISILGGYDCSSWTYGSSSVTTIMNGDFVQQNSTLEVKSPQIGPGTVLGGLTIVGATPGVGATQGAGAIAAIYDHNGASPTVSNDVIVAPSVTTSAGAGGVGIYIADTASPDVYNSQISGGAGTTGGTTFSDFATAAVVIAVQGGTPQIHGNTINGGSGAAPNGGGAAQGSVGIRVNQCNSLLTGGAAIESNTINGGSGSSATAGIALDPSLQTGCIVDILDNTITGGTATASASVSAGIDVREPNVVVIARNRIVGSLSTSVAHSYGVNSTNGTQILLVNNMIHAGLTTQVATGALLFGQQDQNKPSLAAFNTIFGGQAGFSVALGTFIGPLNVYSNILIGGGNIGTSTPPIGLWMYACPTSTNPVVTEFNANLVFSAPGGILGINDPCAGGPAYTTIATAEAFVGSTRAAGNLTANASCTESQCVHLANCDGRAVNTQACLEGLFTQWSLDDGYGTLVPPGPGWVLASTTPCSIAAGAQADSTYGRQDLFQNPRPQSPSHPSMGADQFTGTCSP